MLIEAITHPAPPVTNTVRCVEAAKATAAWENKDDSSNTLITRATAARIDRFGW